MAATSSFLISLCFVVCLMGSATASARYYRNHYRRSNSNSPASGSGRKCASSCIKDLETKTQANAEAIAALSQEKDVLSGQVTELQGNVSNLQSELAAKMEIISGLNETIEALEDRVAALEARPEVCVSVSEDWLNTPCTDDSQCDFPNAGCFSDSDSSNVCLCNPGFFYSEESRCCLQGCDEFSSDTTSAGYLTYSSVNIDSSVGFLDQTQDTANCFFLCSMNPGCVAFVEDPDAERCFYYDSTALENTVEDAGFSGTFSQRRCM